MAGTYHYKIVSDSASWTATAFGEMADGLEEVSGGTMEAVEKDIYSAVLAKAGLGDYTYTNTMVTPTVSLWTACIGTAMAGSFGGGGGGGGEVAAAAPAGDAKAAAAAPPPPEEEEEEEEMGFDLFD